MNRKPANAYDDSDDSASDWDTTAADSPVRTNAPPPFRTVEEEDEPDGDYATVTPKSRVNLKGFDPSSGSYPSKSPPKTTPRKDIPKRKEEVFSPPPHLNSFKNALSDYSELYEPAPDVPPKLYEDRGQVYTIADDDADRSVPQVTINWDDSDADEKVLKELRQNREKEKDRQRQEAKADSERDQQQQQKQQQKQHVTVNSKAAADNQGFEPSPKNARSNKSKLEQWATEGHHDPSTVTYSLNGGEGKGDGRSVPSDRHKKMKKRKPALLPVTVRDSRGKKCVFYFEDTSQHFLEAAEDDIDAFLPDKLQEIENVYRRVWREMFSAVRIVTSFFVLFVTEFLSLVIHHILQPLVLDSLTALGNYFLKPLMTIVFNMIIQPFFALVWNAFNALFMAAGPFVQLLGAICTQIAIVISSFRLFHISYHSQHPNPQWKPPEVV